MLLKGCLVVILLRRPAGIISRTLMTTRLAVTVILQQNVALTMVLLVDDIDAIFRWGMTCPLLSEPATELLCPDRSTATTDTESFDDPQIGSTPSINGRETSLNQRVRKKVGAVIVVAVTAHARSTIVVPRGLYRHSVLVPLPVVVHSLRSCTRSKG